MNTHNQRDTFPIDSLPEELKAVIREVEITMQFPTAIIAASMFSTMSTSCQGLFDVHMPTGDDVATSLFMLTIAESGEGKNFTDNLFTKPISDYQAARQKYARDSAYKLESEQGVWDIKLAEIKRKIKKAVRDDLDTSQLVEEQAAHLKSKPVPPKTPKLLYSNITPEALLDKLAFEWPFAALQSSEAMSVLNGRAIQQLDALNELWDGTQLIWGDRRHLASFELTDARLTLSLMVQNQAFEEFCARNDNSAWEAGFLARALVVCPASRQGQRSIYAESQTQPVFKALLNFHETTLRLLSLTQKRFEENQPRTVLRFSAEAQLTWLNYAQSSEIELGPDKFLSQIKGFGSKIMNNLSRIAGLFHCYTSESDEISNETLVAAWEVMGWYAHQYKAIFGPKDQEFIRAENAKLLKEWLLDQREKKSINRHLVTQLYKFGPKKLRSKEDMQLAIKDLTSQYFIYHNSDQKPAAIELIFPKIENNSPFQNISMIPPNTPGLTSRDIVNSGFSHSTSSSLGGFFAESEKIFK